jgi:hypothetical protein
MVRPPASLEGVDILWSLPCDKEGIMPNNMKGTWKIRAIHQHLGTDFFLDHRDSYTVPDYADSNNFKFGFRIKGSDYDPSSTNMTEDTGNNDKFSGSFSHGGSTYAVRAHKYTKEKQDFIIGVIGKPDLNNWPPGGHLPDPTDVISFTAVKTSG